jgi:hypothetical protein
MASSKNRLTAASIEASSDAPLFCRGEEKGRRHRGLQSIRSAVTITGEPADFEDVGSSGLRVLRRHCRRCGSPLSTVPDLMPLTLKLRSAAL